MKLNLFDLLCLAIMWASTVTMAIVILGTWFLGVEQATLWFNKFHEQAVETIMFPLGAIGGVFLAYKMIRRRKEEPMRTYKS